MSLYRKQKNSLFSLKKSNPSKYQDLFRLDISKVEFLQLNQPIGGIGPSLIISDTLLITENSLELLTEDNKELAVN